MDNIIVDCFFYSQCRDNILQTFNSSTLVRRSSVLTVS